MAVDSDTQECRNRLQTDYAEGPNIEKNQETEKKNSWLSYTVSYPFRDGGCYMIDRLRCAQSLYVQVRESTLLNLVPLTQAASCDVINSRLPMLCARIQQWCVSKTPYMIDPPQRHWNHQPALTQTKACAHSAQVVLRRTVRSDRPTTSLG